MDQNFELKDSAFKKAKGVLRAGGELSTKPIYSRVRFMANLGPALKVFDSALHAESAADLKAFDYSNGLVASAGGFGANTTAKIKHTNVTTQGECPNGGDAFVAGFEVIACPLKKPVTANTVNGIVDDSLNTSNTMEDSLLDSGAVESLQGGVLKMISECYLAYFQIAGKQREYLGALEWRKTDAGYVAKFICPEGWVWEKGMKVSFGFERVGSITNLAKASAPNFYAVVDDVTDGTTVDNTAYPILQDVIVQTIGARFDPKAA